MDRQRHPIELFQDEFGIDTIGSGSPKAVILTSDQAKKVKSVPPVSAYKDFFTGKLPSIGNIAFTTYLGFISIEKLNPPLLSKSLQLGKQFYLMLIQPWMGLTLYSFSDALISCAKAFKKLVNASLPTGLLASLRLASHSALAIEIRLRLAFTAALDTFLFVPL